MKASPISWEETRRAPPRHGFALALVRRRTLQTRSLTNSRMASATLVEAAMAATHEAKDDPVPSARSHMVRKPSIDAAPRGLRRAGSACSFSTWAGSKGSAMAATKRLALPSK